MYSNKETSGEEEDDSLWFLFARKYQSSERKFLIDSELKDAISQKNKMLLILNIGEFNPKKHPGIKQPSERKEARA